MFKWIFIPHWQQEQKQQKTLGETSKGQVLQNLWFVFMYSHIGIMRFIYIYNVYIFFFLGGGGGGCGRSGLVSIAVRLDNKFLLYRVAQKERNTYDH